MHGPFMHAEIRAALSVGDRRVQLHPGDRVRALTDHTILASRIGGGAHRVLPAPGGSDTPLPLADSGTSLPLRDASSEEHAPG